MQIRAIAFTKEIIPYERRLTLVSFDWITFNVEAKAGCRIPAASRVAKASKFVTIIY
jgi:hypothetical protein